MTTSGISRVSAVVWPWRDTGERDVAAEKRRRERRSFVQVAIMATAALVLSLRFDHHMMAGVISCLAVVMFLSARFYPPIFLGVERVVMVIAKVVGIGLTWLLLVPFFYLCFVPGRILLLILGRDPLHRQFEKEKPTYWMVHPEPHPDHFRKQY